MTRTLPAPIPLSAPKDVSMDPSVSATLGIGWQIDSITDIVGLIAIIAMVLFSIGWTVKMIGNGKLKPAVVKEYFFPKKPSKKDYPRQEPAQQDYIKSPLLPDKYAREVLVLVERSIDHHERLNRVEQDTLEKQMRDFEELEISIMALLKKGFLTVCKQVELKPEVIPHARKMYASLCVDLSRDMKDHFRKWCRTNHFYEMDDEERRKYMLSKIEVVFHLASEHFDDEWTTPGGAITRDHLHAISDKHGDEIKVIMTEILKRAFRSSEDMIRKMNEEKAKYSSYVMAISGYDPYDITRC